MRKALYCFFIIALFTCSEAFGFGKGPRSTSDVKQVVNRAAPIEGVVLFNDTTIPGTSRSAWSDPVYVGSLNFDEGTNRNHAYLTAAIALANTSTSSNGELTLTYQYCYDKDCNLRVNESSSSYPYGLFGSSSSDGFDPNEGTDDYGVTPWVASTTEYGAGPWCVTLTKAISFPISRTNYIRFHAGNPADDESVTFDAVLIGGN